MAALTCGGKFRVGDRVIHHARGAHTGNYDFRGSVGKAIVGGIYTISAVGYDTYSVEGSSSPTEPAWYYMDENFDITTNKYVNMNLIEKAALAFKGEPEKSFIKAGILDSAEMPTPDGIKLAVAYLLKKDTLGGFSDAFKKNVVDPILKEEEKK